MPTRPLRITYRLSDDKQQSWVDIRTSWWRDEFLHPYEEWKLSEAFLNTGSAPAMAFARSKFSTCLSTHSARNEVGEHSFVRPTRLLDLSSLTTFGRIHLRRTSDLPAAASYATLNHRWGSKLPLRLESKLEIAWMTDGVLVAQLGKTFRETLSYTQSLDIHYLWIDSMCIIQDSQTDWLYESQKWGDLRERGYQHSRGRILRRRRWAFPRQKPYPRFAH